MGKPSEFSFRIDQEPCPAPAQLPDFREKPLNKRDGLVHANLVNLHEAAARELFSSLFDYFDLGEFNVPLPPSGLPGAQEIFVDDDTKKVIGLGIAYLRALAENKPRRRLNLWKEVERCLAEYKNT